MTASRFNLFILSILLTVLYSCNEKINYIGEFKETAVVYGLLDHADSLHYIKINRAFIGPGNALDIAQIPDSNYFSQVDATVSEYLDGNLVRTWELRDTLLTTKDTNGLFFAPEQKVYYFKTLPTLNTPNFGTIQNSANPQLSSLKPYATYKLNVVIDGGKYTVKAETQLVNGITSPASGQNFTFKFADDPAEYLSAGLTASNTGNSFVMNAQMDVEFNEISPSGTSVKSFNWRIGEFDVNPNNSRTFTVLGKTFYELIDQNCTNDPTITRRTFKGMWITFTGGAEELYNYMLVNKPSSTLAQSKPSYTNLEINNGGKVIGVFSSRQTVRFYKSFSVGAAQAYIRAIDKKSTRELCIGPINQGNLFCSDHPGDNVNNQEEPYACQ